MARGILDSAWPYFGLAGLLLAVAVLTQFEVQVPTRNESPVSALEQLSERDDLNVVFLLIDTLRADRLGIYGYERPTSPILDELAGQGILFEDAVAQSSWTKTSMASLWTGTHPIRNGVLRFNHVLPNEATLPAEIFQEAGYTTVGLWRNGWVEPNFGFGQGFDTYVRPTPGAERQRIHRDNPAGAPVTGTDQEMIVSAVDFLRQAGDERFFLYMHFMDIHQYVYDDTSAIFGTSYSDAYDQSIHWTDRLLGVFFNEMRDLDMLKNTLFVIASDHGEAFREHGYEGHARNLYHEVTHVPLILIPPFLLEEGVRVQQPVSNVDIWPTVLELVGLPPLPGADGRSLLPVILEAAAGEESTEPAPVYAQLARGWGQPSANPRSLVSITHDGKRLIRMLEDAPSGDASEEEAGVERPAAGMLFDRATDIAETTNLAETQDVPPAFDTLLRDYRAIEGQTPWGAPPTEVELDELRLNHLRALGYVIQQ